MTQSRDREAARDFVSHWLAYRQNEAPGEFEAHAARDAEVWRSGDGESCALVDDWPLAAGRWSDLDAGLAWREGGGFISG